MVCCGCPAVYLEGGRSRIEGILYHLFPIKELSRGHQGSCGGIVPIEGSADGSRASFQGISNVLAHAVTYLEVISWYTIVQREHEGIYLFGTCSSS